MTLSCLRGLRVIRYVSTCTMGVSRLASHVAMPFNDCRRLPAPTPIPRHRLPHQLPTLPRDVAGRAAQVSPCPRASCGLDGALSPSSARSAHRTLPQSLPSLCALARPIPSMNASFRSETSSQSHPCDRHRSWSLYSVREPAEESEIGCRVSYG